jgi:hypothetical protein
MRDLTGWAHETTSSAELFSMPNCDALAQQGSWATTALKVCELIEELSRGLYGAPSFARALEAWCKEHNLSSGPISVLRHQQGSVAAIAPDTLAQLAPSPGEPIYYRRVQLVRGSLILAEADNWFMPHRLLQGMRDALENTNIAFEIVVEPLDPSRRSFYLHSWYPSLNPSRCPETQHGDIDLAAPDIISEHRAIIVSGSGNPLAILRERCRRELISFALPI